MKSRAELESMARRIRLGIAQMTHQSGLKGAHLGGSMSVADILAVLYGDVLHYDLQNPLMPERDRVILSKAHAAVALYAALHEAGFLTDEEISHFDRIRHGLDWGFFPDPWAFNDMYYDANHQELFIFGELTKWKMGNEATAELLKVHGLTREDKIIADSSEPKSVADYNKFGLRCIGAEKGPGSVDYSMKWLQSLKAIIIDPKRCKDTYEEFSAYEYEHTKDGEIISGYPDANNHHIDAVRYGTEDIWKKPGDKKPSIYKPLWG